MNTCPNKKCYLKKVGGPGGAAPRVTGAWGVKEKTKKKEERRRRRKKKKKTKKKKNEEEEEEDK